MAEGIDRRFYEGPDEPAYRSHKNRKRWCKGKPGVEHVPHIAKPPNLAGWNKRDCRYDAWGENFWLCDCHELCSVCGKSLRWPIERGECPTWRSQQ